ncbi:BrnA antitoxin family protein [Bradyrhizobium sp. dw_78]|uniref:BrnA antitoxin family protein n=1 Tax=Bradyrhizobium sp. dw_78 TaxID=2719793 RepID=UPI001BD573B3|nr:BrnA antitoxin family protein [Bradyrhizobium sp. dw_78]
MAKTKAFKPGQGYTKADWDEVSDNPSLTKEQLARMKPFAEVLPELAKTITRRGPQKEPTKVAVNIRLSPIVLEHFKSKGPGWQTKIDDELVRIVTKKPAKKRKAKTPRRAA